MIGTLVSIILTLIVLGVILLGRRTASPDGADASAVCPDHPGTDHRDCCAGGGLHHRRLARSRGTLEVLAPGPILVGLRCCVCVCGNARLASPRPPEPGRFCVFTASVRRSRRSAASR